MQDILNTEVLVEDGGIYIFDWSSENWDGKKGKEAVQSDFNTILSNDVHILFASYADYYGYSGDAFVLFERKGKLYEVNASHCSCYGLEGQWNPEQTTVEAILARIVKSNYDGCAKSEFYEILETYLSFFIASNHNLAC